MAWQPSTAQVSSLPAWLAAAAVPIGFGAGIALAYWIGGALADDTVLDQRSAVADVIGLAVMTTGAVVPALAAWRLGLRAEHTGNRRGRWPRVAAAALAAASILWVLGSIIANAAQGRY